MGGVLCGLSPAPGQCLRAHGLLRIPDIPAGLVRNPALPQGQGAAEGAPGKESRLPEDGRRDREDNRCPDGDKEFWRKRREV